MPTENPVLILLKNPLDPVTRRERSILLALSALSLALIKFHIHITEAPILGFKFSQPNQNLLYISLLIATVYFLLAFALYASIDIMARRLIYQAAIPDFANSLKELDEARKAGKTLEFTNRSSLHWLGLADAYFARFTFGDYLSFFVNKIAWTLRAWIFEFWAPIFFGLYAVLWLLWGLDIHPSRIIRRHSYIIFGCLAFVLLLMVLGRLLTPKLKKRLTERAKHMQNLAYAREQMDLYDTHLIEVERVRHPVVTPGTICQSNRPSG